MIAIKSTSVMLAGALLGAGVAATPARAAEVSPTTRANALTAMAGEAFAHASYLAYAQVADQTGEPWLARLFRSTARIERYDHFAAEARLISFAGSNADNLRTSVAGEQHEATTLYPSFAAQARRDGCEVAAEQFEEFAADEARHARLFQAALDALLDPADGQIPVGEPVAPVPIRPGPPQCTGQTLENLDETLRGEALANAKYTLYAEQARRTGQPRLAQLWTNIAGQELGEHFSETAYLAGLAGSDEENLRAALDGEVYEATSMYPSFARQAAEAGDQGAARLFREIAGDEAWHAHSFIRALARLEAGTTWPDADESRGDAGIAEPDTDLTWPDAGIAEPGSDEPGSDAGAVGWPEGWAGLAG